MLFCEENDILSVDLLILANLLARSSKKMFIFSITITRGTPSDISRNPG
jgi:hypothetical protein